MIGKAYNFVVWLIKLELLIVSGLFYGFICFWAGVPQSMAVLIGAPIGMTLGWRWLKL